MVEPPGRGQGEGGEHLLVLLPCGCGDMAGQASCCVPSLSPGWERLLQSQRESQGKPLLHLHPAFSLSLQSLKGRAKPCCCQISHLRLLVGGRWWEGRWRSGRALRGWVSAGHGLGEAAGWGPWLLPAAPGWASGQFLHCLVVVWLQTDIYSENQPN